MAVYRLKANARSPSHNVVFKAGKVFDRIDAFFVSGDDPPGTAFRPPLEGTLQPGVRASALHRLDYLPSFGGIPLFSAAFVQALGDVLRTEVEFHPCTVLCEDRPHEWYIARLLRRVHLLAPASSDTGDGAMRSQADCLRADLHEDFFLARERNELKCHVFVASDAFRAETGRHGLHMGFVPMPVAPR